MTRRDRNVVTLARATRLVRQLTGARSAEVVGVNLGPAGALVIEVSRMQAASVARAFGVTIDDRDWLAADYTTVPRQRASLAIVRVAMSQLEEQAAIARAKVATL